MSRSLRGYLGMMGLKGRPLGSIPFRMALLKVPSAYAGRSGGG